MDADYKYGGNLLSRLRLGVGIVLLWLCANSLAATDRDIAFVQGNLEFILLHELAHVLIEDREVPIIGPRENAADYLAVMFLIGPDRFSEDEAERARLFLSAVANGFATEWELNRLILSELPFWDSHALGIQRFFQISCLLYGSSPTTFSNLPARIGLPGTRAAQCEAEFQAAEKSARWLGDTYKRGENALVADIKIDYQAPPSRISRLVLASMRDIGLLENAVAQLRNRFDISDPLTISVRQCGKANAIWDQLSRTITICYELIDYYYLLARNPKSRDWDMRLGEDKPQ